MSKKNFAIFGLGSFGSKLALELTDAGHNVLVCDLSQTRIDDFCDKVAEVVVADVSNADAVRELNVGKFDAVILGMSSHFEKQVLALNHLKQENAKRIIAKANSDIQEQVLYRLGADRVIQPDQTAAETLARDLSQALVNVNGMIEFEGYAITEVVVSGELAGSTLRTLDLRNRHHITVLLLRRAESSEKIPPGPDIVLNKGDQLTVFGSREVILELFKEE